MQIRADVCDHGRPGSTWEFSPLKRWIATTDGSALAIASEMAVSSAATTSVGARAGRPGC